MGVSAIRQPPHGSELAARVEAMDRGAKECPLVLNQSILAEFIEASEVIREPRLWKLPTELVARHYVPAYVQATAGDEAASAIKASERLSFAFARLLQSNDYATVSAEKRAKEPAADLRPTILLVYAEFLAVQAKLPDASENRLCELTGINLGASREPIHRNTIRRAVRKGQSILRRLPPRHVDLLLRAMLEHGQRFQPGWNKTLG